MRTTTIIIIIICLILTAGAELFAQDAENVELVGSIYHNWGAACAVAVSGDLAYVATGGSGLAIVDISDPENPVEIGYCDTPGYAWGVAVSGDLAFVADEEAGLRVVDVSNPEEPEEVGYYDTPGRAYGVAVSGDLAFVADYDAGLRVLDVSNPEEPEEVGYCDTPGYAYGVAVSGDLAFVADYDAGLRVLDVSNPEEPEEVGYYDTPGIARGVAVNGGLIFVADSYYLGVYRFTDPAAVEDSAPELAREFALSPAFPNPFNSTTSIRYSLPLPTHASLVVYNTLGQRLRTIFEGYKHPGFHTANLKADNLPSGLYFVRLEASGQLSSQKVMLVR